jgi:hypothetical protein
MVATPDPTLRTVEAVSQAVRSLEEKFDVKFQGYEAAVQLLQEFANRQPTTEAVFENLKALKELSETKLTSLEKLIEAKFEGNKTALDVALRAQKENADKTENSFMKQFENITANMATMSKTLEDKIGEVRDRYGTSQGIVVGTALSKTDSREDNKLVYALIGAIAVIVSVGIAVLGFVAKGG